MKTSRCFLVAVASFIPSLALLAADFHDHLGIQMWSLRDQVKADLPAALDLVKSYGLTEIETAGTGNLPVADFMKLLNDRSLKPVGAHMGYEALEKDLPGAIQTAKTLGVKYVVTPWIPHGKDGLTAELAHKAAADFNKWGAAFRAEGITYGLHPHGFEFVPLASEGGKTAFEVIAAETKPEFLSFEMDVFWVVHAGQDPVKLLRKYGSRWALMHVKDIRKGAMTGLSTGGAPPIDNVTVGTGQIDWPAVLKTGEEVGVKHFLIEDETPTPLVCIPDSLKYLRGLKL
ncbi:MAG TPA: sugar phosphate isomerase/epimerase [Lacunisphaera sp.]